MSNIKLGNDTINNVNTIKVQNADVDGQYVSFAAAIGYFVTFVTDGATVYKASCAVGGKVTSPQEPTKANYQFKGWYTADGSKVVFPYQPTADTTLTAQWESGWTATVSNLGASNPNTVSFIKSSNYPTSFEEVTFNGDVFIKIPTVYRKVNTVVSNQITSWTISNSQIDSTYKPYPCFVDESGNILPYILIGKYMNSSSSSCVSTGTSVAGQTIGNGRALARNRGTGYQIMDWMIKRLWEDLVILAYGKININSGSGITNDALGIYWGSYGQWVDGVAQNSGVLAVSYKPSKYVDSATTSTDGYEAVSYNLPTTSGQEIQKLGYDEGSPFVNLPSAVTDNSSYDTYYCDFCDYASGNRPVSCNVGRLYAYSGAFCLDAYYVWPSELGVRLCYRPINQ